MIRRKHLSLQTKLASALLQLKDQHGLPTIPWEHAQMMSAAQISSLWEWDHYPIRVEAGGTDHPSNIVPRLIRAHRVKTAKIDTPEAGKIKRLSKAEEEFRARMLVPRIEREPKKSKWPKRPMRRDR